MSYPSAPTDVRPMDCATPAAPSTPLSDSFQHLRDRLSRIEHAVESLGTQLRPVLRPEEQARDPLIGPTYGPGLSNVTLEIHEQADRADRIADELFFLIARLDT